jgi:hypothetical protein
MTVPFLSEAVLRELSTGSGGDYFFDFSDIHSRHYDSLLRTLQRFALKSVDAIGFSCDKLAACESDHAPLPATVLSSIAHTKTQYVRNTIELLCYVVPNSDRLSSVFISNLQIKREQLARMSIAFGRSRALRELRFSGVRMQDDGLRVLLTGLNPNILEAIAIVECGITARSTDDILKFITRKDRIGAGLRVFDVSPNEISEANRNRIGAFLSGNLPTTSTIDGTEQEAEEEGSEESEFDIVKIEREGRIRQLREDNRLLKEQIKALMGLTDAVKVNDSIFIVGRGATAFLGHLNEMEQRLITLDAQQRL